MKLEWKKQFTNISEFNFARSGSRRTVKILEDLFEDEEGVKMDRMIRNLEKTYNNDK